MILVLFGISNFFEKFLTMIPIEILLITLALQCCWIISKFKRNILASPVFYVTCFGYLIPFFIVGVLDFYFRIPLIRDKGKAVSINPTLIHECLTLANLSCFFFSVTVFIITNFINKRFPTKISQNADQVFVNAGISKSSLLVKLFFSLLIIWIVTVQFYHGIASHFIDGGTLRGGISEGKAGFILPLMQSSLIFPMLALVSITATTGRSKILTTIICMLYILIVFGAAGRGDLIIALFTIILTCLYSRRQKFLWKYRFISICFFCLFALYGRIIFDPNNWGTTLPELLYLEFIDLPNTSEFQLYPLQTFGQSYLHLSWALEDAGKNLPYHYFNEALIFPLYIIPSFIHGFSYTTHINVFNNYYYSDVLVGQSGEKMLTYMYLGSGTIGVVIGSIFLGAITGLATFISNKLLCSPITVGFAIIFSLQCRSLVGGSFSLQRPFVAIMFGIIIALLVIGKQKKLYLNNHLTLNI